MEEINELRQTLAELRLSQSELARQMKELGDDRDEKNILRSIQRMVAGDIRVSGEMRALLGSLSRPTKPFEFKLTQAEIDEIRNVTAVGGHQTLHRRLTRELESGSTVTFTDEELGELIRYMTRYGSGGFQERLQRAFRRSLRDLFGNSLAIGQPAEDRGHTEAVIG